MHKDKKNKTLENKSFKNLKSYRSPRITAIGSVNKSTLGGTTILAADSGTGFVDS